MIPRTDSTHPSRAGEAAAPSAPARTSSPATLGTDTNLSVSNANTTLQNLDMDISAPQLAAPDPNVTIAWAPNVANMSNEAILSYLSKVLTEKQYTAGKCTAVFEDMVKQLGEEFRTAREAQLANDKTAAQKAADAQKSKPVTDVLSWVGLAGGILTFAVGVALVATGVGALAGGLMIAGSALAIGTFICGKTGVTESLNKWGEQHNIKVGHMVANIINFVSKPAISMTAAKGTNAEPLISDETANSWDKNLRFGDCIMGLMTVTGLALSAFSVGGLIGKFSQIADLASKGVKSAQFVALFTKTGNAALAFIQGGNSILTSVLGFFSALDQRSSSLANADARQKEAEGDATADLVKREIELMQSSIRDIESSKTRALGIVSSSLRTARAVV